MKKRGILFPFICFLLFASMATDRPFTLKKSFPIQTTHFTVDKFGNIYTASDKLLQKYDSAFHLLYSYSNLNTGKLQSIDAENPLKLLLFYPDFAKITILDSRLSVQAEIDLRALQMLQPTAVCSSYNENLWIFDLQDFQLRRIDKNLSINNESGNLIQILGYTPHPNFMLESNNWLYVNNPKTGILVFDIYGTYYKTIPIEHIQSFRIFKDQLTYLKNNEIGIYHLKKFTESKFPIPSGNQDILSAIIGEKDLYILTKDSVKIYSY